jgi:hypothetical protein
MRVAAFPFLGQVAALFPIAEALSFRRIAPDRR